MTATFYFDLGSPYAYLAAERVDQVLPAPPTWQPILLGAVFARTGRGSWADTPSRRAGMEEVQRRAKAYGLPPVRWPDPFPGNTLAAMRAATFAQREGRVREFARAAFREAFVAGQDLTRTESVMRAAAAAGLDPDAVGAATQRPDVKDALRAATDVAADSGVFGVPTFAIGPRLFWGDDRLEEAAAAHDTGGD